MPLHKHVTTCRKSGGPISKFCTCEHCTLCVCEVCGSYEGSLTTDCPGAKVSFDRQQEIYETCLDWTDDRGWHQGEPTKRRTSRFEQQDEVKPPAVQPLATDLERELVRKAVAWVLADRTSDDHEAVLSRVEKEVDEHLRSLACVENDEHRSVSDRELIAVISAKLETAKASFHLADQRAVKCDEEFRQVARKLVEALERRGKL